MSPKSFVGFTLITAVIVVAASFSIVSRYGDAGSSGTDERLFPGLIAQVNEITEVNYKDKDLTLTVKRDGDNWAITDRDNYLADPEVVRNMLVGLSELRLGEPKTKVKERYGRLAVEDITEKDARSRLVTLKTGGGDTAAEVIVGRETQDVAGGTGIGVYVRKPGEERAWLASGRLTVPAAVKDWVSPEFMNVDPKRIAGATIRHADGDVMEIERITPTGSKFRIVDLDPNAKVKFASDIDNVADALENLELEDIKKAGDVEFPADKLVKTEYRTADGLVVNAESFETEDTFFWARYKARAADDASPEMKAKAEKEAAEINARVSPWVYRIPAFKYRYMSRRVKDVLEEESKS